jgi:hypothetical protein
MSKLFQTSTAFLKILAGCQTAARRKRSGYFIRIIFLVEENSPASIL